jgi:hypothetical protein
MVVANQCSKNLEPQSHPPAVVCMSQDESLWLLHDERLDPDLSRDRGKSIGGDRDIDDEGSEQNEWTHAITKTQLYCLSIHAHTNRPHQEGLCLQLQLRTQARIEKNATKLVDEWLTHKCEVSQTVEQQNCF